MYLILFYYLHVHKRISKLQAIEINFAAQKGETQEIFEKYM